MFIREGDCNESKLPVTGTVWRDFDTPSTVSIALADLPDGELQLTLRAFGVDQRWTFLKQGKTLSPLPLEERKGFFIIPADKAHGIPETKALALRECPDEVTP